MCTLTLNSCGQRATDERIARVASRQGGTIARWQLLRLGLTASEIEHRVKTGRLRVIYRGVYAVGHDAIPVRGRLFAALLAAGPLAALSHRAAAALHKLIPSMPPFVDLTVTGRRAPRNRADLRFHRATTSRRRPGTASPSPPSPAPSRTSRRRDRRTEVRKALNQALVHRLVTRTSSPIARAPAPPSSSASSRIAAPTRSGLERASSRRCATRRSPSPSPITPSAATSPTSTGPTTASSSRPTAGTPTAARSPSSTTASATPSSPSAASSSSASPTSRSTTTCPPPSTGSGAGSPDPASGGPARRIRAVHAPMNDEGPRFPGPSGESRLPVGGYATSRSF